MNTFHGASAGRSAASRPSSRTFSTRMACVPLGLLWGGVGSISLTSGCIPRAIRASDPVPTRVAAKASAVAFRPTPSGPMKAYAWATRSVSIARRRSATASSCPRIDSSPTAGPPPFQQLLDGARDIRVQGGGVPRGVEHPHAVLLGPRDLEVAFAHAPVKRHVHLLEGVEVADGGAKTSAVRLAGQNHFEAAGMKPLAEPLALGGLS